jgi:hypothetical protein
VLLALSWSMMECVQKTVSVARVYAALESCGRSLREFTPIALSRDEYAAHALLNELGDAERLSDEGYRLELIGDVVSAVTLIVDRIQDDTCRRVGEAALPVRPEFYGKRVGERLKVLVKEGISEDVYKDRRPRVLHDIAVALAREFQGRSRSLPLVCIAGDYDDPALDAGAVALGKGLAEPGIRLVSGYARAGQQVGLAMANALEEGGMVVDADRITQYARTVKDRLHPKGLIGRLIAYGETQEHKRHRMIRDCHVVLLFAGGDGTAQEARIAESYRIPVIPLGFTGGMARRYWQDMLASADPIILGGHPVDPVLYAQLGHGHRDVAVQAALALIRQVITASPVDSCEVPRS